VGAEPGKEHLAREIAASAYRHGAKFVDVTYFDMHVKRARLLHAREDTLDYVPSWYGERVLELGRQRCARVGLTGPVAPGLLDDVDPARAGRDQLPFLKEAGLVVNERTTNWTAVPCPTPAWAQLVHPDLDADAALARLWEQIVFVCRLDEDDPVAAWRERAGTLIAVAERMAERRFTALRFRGPGTDLTVGLLPTTRAPTCCAATRPATRARRGSARSRSLTARAASARPTRSSSTPCWTRTPPATSRSARRTGSRPATRIRGG